MTLSLVPLEMLSVEFYNDDKPLPAQRPRDDGSEESGRWREQDVNNSGEALVWGRA